MIGSCLAAGAGAFVAAGLLGSKRLPRDRKPRHSRVAVLRVDSYSDRLLEVLMQGLKLLTCKSVASRCFSNQIWSTLFPAR